MSKYTVMGAGGFVGGRVVAHLRAQGIEPYCPTRDDAALWSRDLGYIFYCAGLTGDYRTRPFATVEAHVSLLARILETARFDRIVYLSSTRLYDDQPARLGVADQAIAIDPGNAESLYELSKMLGENLTLHRSAGRGVVARLSYVFGWDEGAEGFLSDWLRRACEAQALSLDSDPSFSRDYIHVDDVTAILKSLLDGDARTIVNVARGESITNGAIAALFEKHGRSVRFTRSGEAARAGAIDVSGLAALGLAARPVLPLIDAYLSDAIIS